jgi:hypothetical protein
LHKELKFFGLYNGGMDPPYPAPHDWREWRRMRALELKQLGWKRRDIAAALGVTEGAVSHWLAASRRGGRDALLSHWCRERRGWG